jgi:hypothetical protein
MRSRPGIGQRVRRTDGPRIGSWAPGVGGTCVGPPMARVRAPMAGGRAPPCGLLRTSVSHVSPLRPAARNPVVRQSEITTSWGIGWRRRYLVGDGRSIRPGSGPAVPGPVRDMPQRLRERTGALRRPFQPHRKKVDAATPWSVATPWSAARFAAEARRDPAAAACSAGAVAGPRRWGRAGGPYVGSR